MKLVNNLGDDQIQNVVKNYPHIGEILNHYEIGCVECGVGICLLKDVVSIHALGEEIEKKIEQEINDYLDKRQLTTNNDDLFAKSSSRPIRGAQIKDLRGK